MLRVLGPIGFLAALQFDLPLVSRLDRLIDQIANDLMTTGRNADSLAAPHHFADHARAGESLPRTRRTLDGQDANGQMRAEPNGRFDGRLTWPMQRLPADAGIVSNQQIARRLIRSVPTQTAAGDILTDPHKSVLLFWAAHDLVREDRFGMNVGSVLALLDVDRPVRE